MFGFGGSGPTAKRGTLAVYRTKPMSAWTVEDTVIFFRDCVTEKKKVLNNIRSKEVDGDLLRAMDDDELEEHVGLDGLMVKKLRKKMDSVAKDEESENKIAALITFLEKIHLTQYHDKLVNDLGVSDIKELPDLIDNEDFLDKVGLKFAEKARFQNAVRGIMHPSNPQTSLQPRGKLGGGTGTGTPGGSSTPGGRPTGRPATAGR